MAESVPVTWSELLAAARVTAPYDLNDLRELPARIGSKPLRFVAIKLASAADSLSSAAIVLGPEGCLPFFPLLADYFDRAVADFKSGVARGASVRALGLLNYLNLARCCGAEVPRSADGLEQAWLPQLAKFAGDFTEEESKTLAFAALGAALPDLVPAVIGGGALPSSFEPGKSFQFNVQGFAHYVASAMLAEATPEQVEPAWHDFVENFPRKLASQTLRWVDLMWAARAMMEHIEHRPAATTASELHEFVT